MEGKSQEDQQTWNADVAKKLADYQNEAANDLKAERESNKGGLIRRKSTRDVAKEISGEEESESDADFRTPANKKTATKPSSRSGKASKAPCPS